MDLPSISPTVANGKCYPLARDVAKDRVHRHRARRRGHTRVRLALRHPVIHRLVIRAADLRPTHIQARRLDRLRDHQALPDLHRVRPPVHRRDHRVRRAASRRGAAHQAAQI